jgi:hypothetical protein
VKRLHQLDQDLERRSVYPVEVIENDHYGGVRTEVEEPAGQLLGERSPVEYSECLARPGPVTPNPLRRRARCPERRRPHDLGAASAGLIRKAAEQAGLADPGLARAEHEAWSSGHRLVEQCMKSDQLLGPTEPWLHRTQAAHDTVLQSPREPRQSRY